MTICPTALTVVGDADLANDRLGLCVAVSLTLSDAMTSFLHEEIDLAIRFGTPTDGALNARRLAGNRRVLCAAPAYVDSRGAPATPEDLRGHECLGFAYGTTRHRWSFAGPDGVVMVEVSCRHVVNNGQALLTLALAGMGIVLQPASLVRDDLSSGRLVHLLPDHEPPTHPMHILYAPDRRITPKLQSFIDFAVGRLG